MKLLSFLTILVFLISSCSRVDPTNADPKAEGLTFIKTIGSGFEDVGNSISAVSDGSYLLSGWTSSTGAGLRDMWLLKIDSAGQVLFETVYGDHNNDWGYNAIETSDNSLLICGRNSSYGMLGTPVSTFPSTSLIKTDQNGNQQWIEIYGTAFNSRAARQVMETDDGGYIILAESNKPYIISIQNSSFADETPLASIYKVNANGTLIWAYHHSDWSIGHEITKTNDGGFVIVGQQGIAPDNTGLQVTISPFNNLVFKLNAQGNLQWAQEYDYSDWDISRSVALLDDGYIITGQSGSFSTNDIDLMLLKIDHSGNELWHRIDGGNQRDFGSDIIVSSDNNFVIVGMTYSYDVGNGDVWLLKYNQSGAQQWARSIGAEKIDIGKQLIETTDLGFLIIGETDSYGTVNTDLLLIKTDRNGRVRIE